MADSLPVHGALALRVQLLERVTERVLVMAVVAGQRATDRWFSPQDVVQLFLTLHLPPPGNVSQTLTQLRIRNLVINDGDRGRWALTPLGEQEVRSLAGEASLEGLHAEAAPSAAATFADVQQPVVDPMLAPPRWTRAVSRLLERSPFQRNVFCMSRFPGPDESSGLTEAITVARNGLAMHGLTMRLASDGQVDDELFGNVGAYMWASHYGIGILETRSTQGLNLNVMLELGAMVFAGRRCAILRDRSVEEVPSDIAGHIYVPVDLGDMATVERAVHRWATADLGLQSCDRCRATILA